MIKSSPVSFMEYLEKDIKVFQHRLYSWHKTIERNLPWKSSNDPYKIWLSEIILQQTRVEQGTPYYLKFVEHYPTVTDLANASEDEVLKMWQGLGYYSRARNLHFTAKKIVSDFNGQFPKNYKDVLSLKGIGEYTAAAITSFAYGSPYAVVDGNVIRVLTRIFGIEESITDTSTMKQIKELAQLFLDKDDAGKYNQAIMDFGALHCKPKNPKCEECPFNNNCYASANAKVDTIPYKAKKIKKTTEYLHYLILSQGDKYYMTKRESGIWKGLYQPYLLDYNSAPKLSRKAIEEILQEEGLSVVKLKEVSNQYKHILTHKKLLARFYVIEVDRGKECFYSKTELKELALPRLIDIYFKEEGIL